MKKTLQVDSTLKTSLQKKIIKEKGKKARNFLKVFLMVAVLACFAICFFNIISADRAIIHVMGVPKKDYEFIILTTLLGLILSVMTYSFATLFVNRFCTGEELSRIDEGLTMTEDLILYSYRLKHITQPTDRYVVCIPYSKIYDINYNKKHRVICFKGNFLQDYVEMYINTERQTTDQGEINEITIIDYFEPQLRDLLIENGLQMKEEEN